MSGGNDAHSYKNASAPLLVSLTPKQVIRFAPNSQEAELKIENISAFCIAYKLKTTQPTSYTVKPNAGVISPGGHCVSMIRLQSHYTHHEDEKHRFMIQVVKFPVEEHDISSGHHWIKQAENFEKPEEQIKLDVELPKIDTDDDDEPDPPQLKSLTQFTEVAPNFNRLAKHRFMVQIIPFPEDLEGTQILNRQHWLKLPETFRNPCEEVKLGVELPDLLAVSFPCQLKPKASPLKRTSGERTVTGMLMDNQLIVGIIVILLLFYLGYIITN